MTNLISKTTEEDFLLYIESEKEGNKELAKTYDCFHVMSPRTIKNILNGRTLFQTAFKAMQKKVRREEREKRKNSFQTSRLSDILLINNDIRNVSSIEANSVDYIITDPPYPKEYLGLYEDLGVFAKRVLKDNGLMIVMVGQSYLPDIIEKLQKNMSYHWMSSYLTPGGQSTQLWQKHVITFWKPLLIFSKGKYTGDWFSDVSKSDVNANDKRFHKWGQSISGMLSIIEKHTYPNDVICDPFCGGGTTGVACALLGRRFIGIDISENHIDTTMKRIKEVIACH